MSACVYTTEHEVPNGRVSQTFNVQVMHYTAFLRIINSHICWQHSKKAITKGRPLPGINVGFKASSGVSLNYKASYSVYLSKHISMYRSMHVSTTCSCLIKISRLFLVDTSHLWHIRDLSVSESRSVKRLDVGKEGTRSQYYLHTQKGPCGHHLLPAVTAVWSRITKGWRMFTWAMHHHQTELCCQ